MKALFIISSSETAFWLSEVTHPYWHLVERGVDVDFASPQGGQVVYDPYSDPYFENSTGPEDLVSKGFLSKLTNDGLVSFAGGIPLKGEGGQLLGDLSGFGSGRCFC